MNLKEKINININVDKILEYIYVQVLIIVMRYDLYVILYYKKRSMIKNDHDINIHNMHENYDYWYLRHEY